MKGIKKIMVLLAVVACVTGILPNTHMNVSAKTAAKDKYYIERYCNAGDTFTISHKNSIGKVSLVSKSGSKVTVSGKTVKITPNKSGKVVIKVGKKKYYYTIYVDEF